MSLLPAPTKLQVAGAAGVATMKHAAVEPSGTLVLPGGTAPAVAGRSAAAPSAAATNSSFMEIPRLIVETNASTTTATRQSCGDPPPASVFFFVDVERFGRELGTVGVVDADLQRVAAVVVGGDQRQAVLDQLALVDGDAHPVAELGGGDRGPGDLRGAPHERHLRHGALAAPRRDDLVVEVDLPLRVVLDEVLGDIHDRVERAGLVADDVRH